MSRNTKANLATPQSVLQPSTAARLLLLFAIILLSLPSHARYSFGKITESDKLSLPPVCRLILIEKPSAHQPGGQVKNAELLNRAEYRMAKGNIHLHHYCYGLINKNRYFSSKSRLERNRFLNETISEIDYVLKHSPKEWPYFYELYHEQAEMYFLAGDLPKSLNKANSALTHKPDFDKSHALISDIYAKQGKKDRALEQLHAGLNADPTSRRLIRRLKEINPDDPLLNAPSSASSPPQENALPPAEKPTVGDINGVKPLPPDIPGNQSTVKSDAASPETGKASEAAGPVQNASPFCRFCPPD